MNEYDPMIDARRHALECALRTQTAAHSTPEELVATAKLYLDFFMGQTKKETE